MLQVEGLTKSYNGIAALDDVSFLIERKHRLVRQQVPFPLDITLGKAYG